MSRDVSGDDLKAKRCRSTQTVRASRERTKARPVNLAASASRAALNSNHVNSASAWRSNACMMSARGPA